VISLIPIEKFNDYFSNTLLLERFDNKIRYKCASGIDKIGVKKFCEKLDENLNTITRKVLNGTYNFTKYREVLISKGKNKFPRAISLPSIRDKLTLSLLNSFLQSVYKDEIDSRLIHSKISLLSDNINQYTHFIKVDIKGFYSTINHEILRAKLSELLPVEAICLISKAIKTPSVPQIFNKNLTEVKPLEIGVPEGLSISNILADIYLIDVDNYFKSISSLHYCRYVDDILILCNKRDVEHLKREVKNRLVDIKLDLNEEKLDSGEIHKSFYYLGYFFDDKRISARDTAIHRLEHSIEKLFSDYNHKKLNKKLFEWKLNLKITGCVFENKKYGWIFFYSQMNDIMTLKKLDWLVHKLCERFNIDSVDMNIKSFTKTYFEIKYNLSSSTYFISIHKLTAAEKSKIIEEIYNYSVPNTEGEINDVFSKLITRDLRSLEKDIQSFS